MHGVDGRAGGGQPLSTASPHAEAWQQLIVDANAHLARRAAVPERISPGGKAPHTRDVESYSLTVTDWVRAQSVTVWASVCAHKVVGALPRGEVRSGMAGCGFSR